MQYNIKWFKFNLENVNVSMCCNHIQFVKINLFYQYINASCLGKVSPFPRESIVTSESGEEKLLVKCLIKSSNIELQDNIRCDKIVTVLILY